MAQRQMDVEAPPATTGEIPGGEADAGIRAGGSSPTDPGARRVTPGGISASLPRRFHGTVSLDPARVGRDVSRIADEVIAHLAGQVGAEVTVTLEIEALLPNGASDQIVRTVTENARTLKFSSQGFEGVSVHARSVLERRGRHNAAHPAWAGFCALSTARVRADRDGLTGQQNDALFPHLHPLGGDAPFGLVEVKLLPERRSDMNPGVTN